MTDIQKQWAKRILVGGAVGGGIHLALCALLAQVSKVWLQAVPVSPLLLTAQFALAFALGAAVGVGTLPFDDYGPALARRSILHYLITSSFVLLLGWTLGWLASWESALLLLGLYTFLYLVVWLVRYLGWRAELQDLRSALNLPAPPPSKLKWRESLPYLLTLTAFFLLLRPLAELLDAPGVPVLRALFLPWLAYPFVSILVGWAMGRTWGLCPLLFPVTLLAFLPNLLWQSVPYDWWQAPAYAALALAAHLLGAAVRGRNKGG